MIIVRKTPKGNFQVQVTAKNGRILMNSEPLKSKRAAFNNIKASADDDNFNSPDDGFSSRRNIEVQDRTGKEWKTVYLRNY